MDRSEIAKHLILKHKGKEVAVWGYRKDKLKKLLNREQLQEVLRTHNVDEELNVDVTKHVDKLEAVMVLDPVL